MSHKNKIITFDKNKIVNVIPKEDLELPDMEVVIKEKESLKYCSHLYIDVYPYYRVIKCRECGKSLDPFEYLLHIGQQERNLFSTRRMLTYDIKHLDDDKAQLKKEIASLRKEIKKLI